MFALKVASYSSMCLKHGHVNWTCVLSNVPKEQVSAETSVPGLSGGLHGVVAHYV